MTEYCKNCGAELREGGKFCQECGSEVPEISEKNNFCPNCGHDLKESENFCENCGTNLNAPQTVRKEKKFNVSGIVEKYKIPIIIAATVIILAVIIYATLLITAPEPDVGTKMVTVGTSSFIIPGDYIPDPTATDIDYTGYNVIFSQGYDNGEELIHIGVMNIPYGVDGESVAASQGGVYKTLMGVDGYYTENDGIYTFTFVDGAYLNVISVTSPYVFDEITYRG